MEHAVIMAGGVGSRFWPKSRKAQPKQFLTVFGGRSLLQHTSDRLDGLIPPERRIVVTHERYVAETRRQLPEIPAGNVLAEPVGRNTAPCIAFATAHLLRSDPDATMVVLPADHFIQDVPGFHAVLGVAIEQASASPVLVTIGIRPTHPATGYGYIQIDPASLEPGLSAVRVLNFHEKPAEATARRFLSGGDHLWNSGMFIWKSRTVWDEFARLLPEIHAAFAPVLSSGATREIVSQAYERTTGISVDHGILEHARAVYVVPGSFGWSDVGDWRAVYDLSAKDESGNVTNGRVVLHDSQGCLVHAADRLIAVVGSHDLAIVDTGDAILICHLDRTQEVKDVRSRLNEESPDLV